MKITPIAVRVLVLGLLTGLLSPVNFGTPANAANNFVSIGIFADATGRANDNMKISIFSKIPSGVTSVNDRITAAIEGYIYGLDSNGNASSNSANYSDTSFTSTQTPTTIANSITTYNLSFPAPSVPGTYYLKYCVTVPTMVYTATEFKQIYYWQNNDDRYCDRISVTVGGVPTSAFFSHRNLVANTTLASGNSEANSQVSLYDTDGFSTLLSGSEALTIASSSATLSSDYGTAYSVGSGSVPASNKMLVFGTSAGDSDGHFRFVLSDSSNRSSNITAFITAPGLNNDFSAPNAAMRFGTNQIVTVEKQINLKSSQYCGYASASGTDGKFYFWGSQQSAYRISSSLFQKTANKPIKLDFFPRQGQKNNLLIKQIVDCNFSLSSDGSIYALSRQGVSRSPQEYSNFLSSRQLIEGGLNPLENASLSSINILSATKELSYVLDTDGKVWKRGTSNFNQTLQYSILDLTAIGNPVISQIKRSTDTNSLVMLSSTGKLYSVGDNTSGVLGQGSNLGTGTVGNVLMPNDVVVVNVLAGSNFFAAETSTGDLWAWGNNTGGQIAKDVSSLSSSNVPVLVTLPVGETAAQWSTDSDRLSFLSSDRLKILIPNDKGSWLSPIPLSNYFDLQGQTVKRYSLYFYSGGYIQDGIVVLANDKLVQKDGNSVGNCVSFSGTIRSGGQFGPASTDDALRYAGIFYSDSVGTIASTTTIAAKVNIAFTIQVANLQTNCFAIGELTYNWDLLGNGSYGPTVAPVLGNTGYLTLSANLNYSTIGRKTISLRVNSPDGVSYKLDLLIGVESTVSPVVPVSETATATVMASGGNGALGIGSDGNLYTWGYNSYGRLALTAEEPSYRRLPIQVDIPGGAKPQSVFINDETSYVVDLQGKTWAAGRGYRIYGTNQEIDTLTAVSYLSTKNVRDVQISKNQQVGFALQANGQLLSWTLNDASRYTPTKVVSLSGTVIKQFGLQSDDSSLGRLIAIDVDGDVWSANFSNNGTFENVKKESLIIGAKQLAWNGLRATIVTSDNVVWFSSSAALPFNQVSVPSGLVAVDAMYDQVLYLQDGLNQIWTASVAQSQSGLITSAWSKFTNQAIGQANAQDVPILQHRGGKFISFSSGNLLNLGLFYEASSGACSTYSPDATATRVFSTGAFGAYHVIDTIEVSRFVVKNAQNQSQFNSGDFFAADPGDSVVFRILNPRSNCITDSRAFKVRADLDGSGQFATSVPISFEGSGNYSFLLSITAPSSGRKSISLRVIAPSGITSNFNVGLGVYSNISLSEIVPRVTPINTSEAAVLAVSSDGYAYGWATATDLVNRGTTMPFLNLISNSPPKNSGSPTKLQLPGNPKIREAVPFTYCCSRLGQFAFGALVVDENGKTYSWGTESSLRVANGYAENSTPLTPTEIPALVGVNVMRLAVSPNGNKMLALSANGVVYEWHGYEGSNSSYTQPIKMASLAGLKIVDIFANNQIYLVLTSEGDIYSFNGPKNYLGRSIPGYEWEFSYTSGKVNVGEAVKAILPTAESDVVLVLTNSNKIFAFGQFYNRNLGTNISVTTPVKIDLPSSRIATGAGTINYDQISSTVLTASDGTWWNLVGNAQNQIVTYQRSNVPSAISSGVRKFAAGTGQAVQLNDGSIFTTNSLIAGTCGPLTDFTRVMSSGEFGAAYRADQVNIQASGSEITRPGTPATVSLTAWSACDGGDNIVFTADLEGTGTFSSPITGQTSVDGSRATASYTFTKTRNGPINLGFKATSDSGLSGSTTFFTKVVPAPLPGRQIGISINNGARYANSSDVTLNLVWPDGTTKIFVSNDGGFAPGTVSEFDLQYTIPWVLPPQAVIPLPSIVYARFDNNLETYYFDDIIVDSISPILTYVSSS